MKGDIITLPERRVAIVRPALSVTQVTFDLKYPRVVNIWLSAEPTMEEIDALRIYLERWRRPR
jgi:hypothetical protein